MSGEKRVLLLCAEGVEEMEYITIADILVRCGLRVVTAGEKGHHGVKGRQGIYIRPDFALNAVKEHKFRAVILPGGEDAASLFSANEEVGHVLKEHNKRGALICAICASPTALLSHKIGLTKKLTSYPYFMDDLEKHYDYQKNSKVVVDGNLVTSQGPGTAASFALKIAELLVGENVANGVAEGMLIGC